MGVCPLGLLAVSYRFIALLIRWLNWVASEQVQRACLARTVILQRPLLEGADP